MSLEALSNLASLQAPFVFEQQNDDQNNPTPNDVTNENILTRQDSVPALPQLTRQTSLSGAPRVIDWARQVTVEERKFIRDKVKAAYKRKALSYDDLLDACSAIEEELLFGIAPSRLDYFKSGVQYEKRVGEKLVQMQSGVNQSLNSNLSPGEQTNNKRPKTQF